MKYTCTNWEAGTIEHALLELQKRWDKNKDRLPGQDKLDELIKTILQTEKIVLVTK